jgi:broad specificity phosphatase PhoE
MQPHHRELRLGHLTLVRHGQASFFGRNYDQLSPIGEEQARALGRWLVHRGEHFDRVIVGPRLRHRQTEQGVREAYAAARLPLPEAQLEEAFDEHDAIRMFNSYLGRSEADLDAFHSGEIGDGERQAKMREFFKQFDGAFRLWVRGEFNPPGVESWATFAARVATALDVGCTAATDAFGRPLPDGGRTIVFTSGGLVAQSLGCLLGLRDDQVVDLSYNVRNTSLTEVNWTGPRRTLGMFNAAPHLTETTLV